MPIGWLPIGWFDRSFHDEIIANGDLVICRVRTEIPMPEEQWNNANIRKTQKRIAEEMKTSPDKAKQRGLAERYLDKLMNQPGAGSGRGCSQWQNPLES